MLLSEQYNMYAEEKDTRMVVEACPQDILRVSAVCSKKSIALDSRHSK